MELIGNRRQSNSISLAVLSLDVGRVNPEKLEDPTHGEGPCIRPLARSAQEMTSQLLTTENQALVRITGLNGTKQISETKTLQMHLHVTWTNIIKTDCKTIQSSKSKLRKLSKSV